MSRASGLLQEAIADFQAGRWAEARRKFEIVAQRSGTSRSKARRFLKVLEVLEVKRARASRGSLPGALEIQAKLAHLSFEVDLVEAKVPRTRTPAPQSTGTKVRQYHKAVKALQEGQFEEAQRILLTLKSGHTPLSGRAKSHLDFIQAIGTTPFVTFEDVQSFGRAYGVPTRVVLQMTRLGAKAGVDSSADTTARSSGRPSGVGALELETTRQHPEPPQDRVRWFNLSTEPTFPEPGAEARDPLDASSSSSSNLVETLPTVEAAPGEEPQSRSSLAQEPAASLPSAPPSADVSPASTTMLRRTPHLQPHPDRDLVEGERVEFDVWLDTEGFRQGEAGEEVAIETRLDQITLRARCLVSDHFLVDDESRTVTIRRAENEARLDEGPFVARVRNDACKRPGPIWVDVLFDHEGRPSGRIRRSLSVVGAARTEAQPLGGDSVASSGQICAEIFAIPADLQVRIVATPGGRAPYECIVRSAHLPNLPIDREKAEWHLKPDEARQMVRETMKHFTAKGAKPFNRYAALRGAGKEFFTAAPTNFRWAYWQLLDRRLPLRSIAIVSDEPTMPWELMVPNRPEDAATERKPIGVAHAVGRWTSSKQIAARQELRIREGIVVAPRDSNLKQTEAEVALLTRTFSRCSRIDPSTIENLDRTLNDHPPTLLHFICHGTSHASGRQELTLEEGESFSDLHLGGSEGIGAGIRTGRPFVFLNACEVGRSEPALVGVGGFPETFMGLGAAAVIAPLWSVKDSIAPEVARYFYESVRDRPASTVGEILSEIRARAYEKRDSEDSWGAYSLYGDPLARVTIDRTG